MDFKTVLKLTIAGLVILTIGTGVGYYMAPTKVKTETKIVEVEKKVTEQHKKTIKVYDPHTGKVIKETEETGSKVTETDTTKTDKNTEKSQDKKMYALKGGVAVDPLDNLKLTPRVGGEIRLPFFNSWAGAEADINTGHPNVGAYLRMEF